MVDVLVINVRGRIFHIGNYGWKKVKKLSILNEQSEYYNSSRKEYCFDRNPDIFSCVLDYCNSGVLHYPINICSKVVIEELKFWGLDETALASCCWHRFQSDEENEIVLKKVRRIWTSNIPKESELTDKSCRNRLYILLEYPNSSKIAKIWSLCIMALICISIITFMIESIPSIRTFRHENFAANFLNITENRVLYFFMHTRSPSYLVWIEVPISFILLVDFILRFVVHKSKLHFLKNPYHIFDFFGIFPVVLMAILLIALMYVYPTGEFNDSFIKLFFSLNTFRILRVLRLIRFAQHYKSLHLIHLALASSIKELFLLLALLSILAIFFANIIFLAEINQDNFWSIPEGLWWSFITMTTVGYGDYYPKGVFGYIVGVICAVMGILVIAMPVPIVVSNFSSYYNAAQMVDRELKRQKLNKITGHSENKGW